ncbi:bile acid:sodium symporter family protein [Amphritea balenae]|uniref:Bile acid:sodium symporter family protein n=1 Tax=Amphritea balenae TaxID=452629 RepID=A0A3P1SLM8_9GAMM|nr:bile acid:sodium symporter family protein [Amphritea balenae]RRC97814.1 bile acid:sodium symporter family protein [Amphritea balenae]GGK83207.1 hypothetical protein GCM10007941_37190 [Amphritea balenae]
MEGGSALSILLPAALFIIMLGMGLSLNLSNFSRLIERPGVILVGLVFQLFCLPVLAFILVTSFELSPALSVGLMIVSFAPGGATSNMISYLCRADTALSITLTAISSLLVPLTLPWLAWLSLEYFMAQGVMINLPVITTIMKLLMVTIIPVLLGVMIHVRLPELSQTMQKPVKIISLIFMFSVVLLISWANKEQLPELLPVLTPVVLLLSGGAMLMAVLIARYLFKYSAETALTLGIETGIQNAGTGLMITGAILQQPEMSMSVLMYGILMQIPALLLVIWRNLPQGNIVGSVNSQ